MTSLCMSDVLIGWLSFCPVVSMNACDHKRNNLKDKKATNLTLFLPSVATEQANRFSPVMASATEHNTSLTDNDGSDDAIEVVKTSSPRLIPKQTNILQQRNIRHPGLGEFRSVAFHPHLQLDAAALRLPLSSRCSQLSVEVMFS